MTDTWEAHKQARIAELQKLREAEMKLPTGQRSETYISDLTISIERVQASGYQLPYEMVE